MKVSKGWLALGALVLVAALGKAGSASEAWGNSPTGMRLLVRPAQSAVRSRSSNKWAVLQGGYEKLGTFDTEEDSLFYARTIL